MTTFLPVVARDADTGELVSSGALEIYAVGDDQLSTPLAPQRQSGALWPGGLVPVVAGATAAFVLPDGPDVVMGVAEGHRVALWSPEALTAAARSAAEAATLAQQSADQSAEWAADLSSTINVWGRMGGDLAEQGDLAEALAARIPVAVAAGTDDHLTGLVSLDHAQGTDDVRLRVVAVSVPDGRTSETTWAIPVASDITTGLMPSAAHRTMIDLVARVQALGEGITPRGVIDAPTSEVTGPTLTARVVELRGKDPDAGDALRDAENRVWVWTGAGSGWVQWIAGATGIASLTSLGVVRGIDEPGRVFVETDGTMSVVGWDDLTAAMSALQSAPPPSMDDLTAALPAGTASVLPVETVISAAEAMDHQTAAIRWLLSHLNSSGAARTALRLSTPRNLGVNLGISGPALFDGSYGQLGIGVVGTLPVSGGGTGTAALTPGQVLVAGSTDTSPVTTRRLITDLTSAVDSDIPTAGAVTAALRAGDVSNWTPYTPQFKAGTATISGKVRSSGQYLVTGSRVRVRGYAYIIEELDDVSGVEPFVIAMPAFSEDGWLVEMGMLTVSRLDFQAQASLVMRFRPLRYDVMYGGVLFNEFGFHSAGLHDGTPLRCGRSFPWVGGAGTILEWDLDGDLN